jgi:hypothetical protein
VLLTRAAGSSFAVVPMASAQMPPPEQHPPAASAEVTDRASAANE